MTASYYIFITVSICIIIYGIYICIKAIKLANPYEKFEAALSKFGWRRPVNCDDHMRKYVRYENNYYNYDTIILKEEKLGRIVMLNSNISSLSLNELELFLDIMQMMEMSSHK